MWFSALLIVGFQVFESAGLKYLDNSIINLYLYALIRINTLSVCTYLAYVIVCCLVN